MRRCPCGREDRVGAEVVGGLKSQEGAAHKPGVLGKMRPREVIEFLPPHMPSWVGL